MPGEVPLKRTMQPIITHEVTLTDRVFGWWYRIAAPPEVPDEAPLRDRMRVRSGRLTSVIFLLEIINVLINLIVVLLDAPFAAPSLAILLAAVLVGVVLNRFGKTVIAGLLVIGVLEVGLFLNFLNTPGGLSPFTVSIFDVFASAELIAASMLVPWTALVLAMVNCLLVASLIVYLPKTPEMIQLLHTQGYSVFADTMVLQIMVSVTTFLWVNSTYKEMRRANSAEEVNKLTLELTKRQKDEQVEQQRLQESIQQIVQVHMQAANGNFNARVPLDQQNVLWSVAGSLNNLLARLQRWRQDAVQLQYNEQVLAQLLYNIQQARREEKPLMPYRTNTSFDALIMEISKGMPGSQGQADRSLNTPTPPYFEQRY